MTLLAELGEARTNAEVADEGYSTVLRSRAFGRGGRYWALDRDGRIRTARHPWTLASGNEYEVAHLAAIVAHLPPLDATSTVFAGVHRVPPDAEVEIGRANITVRRSRKVVAPSRMSVTDAAEELWALLVANVERAISGAAKVAVLVGGGVDSSAVLAAAVAATRGATDSEIEAFALSYGGYGDDRPHLRALERAFGLEAVRIEPRTAAAFLGPLLRFSGAPFWCPTAPGDLALIARCKENGADVILTGVGGDDVFDGYPRTLGRSFAQGDLRAPLRALRLSIPWPVTARERLDRYVFRPMIAPFLPSSLQRARRRRLNDGRWRRLGGAAMKRFIAEEATVWERQDLDTPSGRYAALSSSTYLAESLEHFARLGDLVGARIEHPLLNENLLELASALPPEHLLTGGRMRGLLRLAARGKVPASVRLRIDKADYTNAQRDMFEAIGGSSALSDLVAMRESGARELVDPEGFRRHVEQIEKNYVTDDDRFLAWTALWPALSVEGFLRARAADSRD